MELNQEKLNELVSKYSKMHERRDIDGNIIQEGVNWLQGFESFADKAKLAIMFDQIDRKFNKDTRFERNVHGIAYHVIRRLFLNFKRFYEIKSFLQVLEKYKKSFENEDLSALDEILVKMDSEMSADFNLQTQIELLQLINK